MVALSFSVFLEKIIDGSKSNTIRQKRNRPIKKGDALQLYWNQRSREGFKIGDAFCKEVTPIIIRPGSIELVTTEESPSEMILRKVILVPEKRDKFARADGFDSWEGMKRFFDRNYGLPFEGEFIEWCKLVFHKDLPRLMHLISSAKVEDDRLIVNSFSSLKTEIAFSQHPILKRIPESDRPNFTIPDDGSYLHWEAGDIHLDLEGIKIELDPHLKARTQESTYRFNLAYGKAMSSIICVRQKLARSAIPTEAEIEAIEQGHLPTAEWLQHLSKAHMIGANEYLELIANEFWRCNPEFMKELANV